jgi:Leucine rich repeat
MEHEVELPPMPTPENCLPSDLSDLHHRRKRPRLEYDVTTSSDPALFSSDDHAPTAENYASKRRKEKWRGTWWGEKVKGRASSVSNGDKRKFKRNFDSGVWMGSEGTDTSVEDELLQELQSTGTRAMGLTFTQFRDERGVQDQPYQPTPETARNAALYAAVETIVDRCLETGDENIDLSSLSFDKVSNKSLRRLRSLTKHTTIQNIPPSQNAYSPIEAALRLYFSNNSLTNVPPEILNLTNLRVLSVRNNELTKLPPGLAKLPFLEHLNIAGNELHYLPYEMLPLFDRPGFEMIATPNPFKEPPSSSVGPTLHPDISSTKPFLVSRSTYTYFHPNGSTTINPAPSTAPSRVPSLLELTLQKSKSLPDLLDIKDWCSSGEGPLTLSGPLAMTQEANAYGDRQCTICSRSFIVPRVEWLEWWDSPSGWKPARGDLAGRRGEMIIPFLRQGCNWACVEEVEG